MHGENIAEGINSKGESLIGDKILEKYGKAEKKGKKESLTEPLKMLKVKSLKDLEEGYTKEGTGFYRDAEHHLWKIEKEGEEYKLIRMEEDEKEEKVAVRRNF